jgi:hypothetical protein
MYVLTLLFIIIGKQSSKDVEIKRKKIFGKCCVIRFTTLSSLYDHLLKNLTFTQFKCRFTIRRVSVINDIPGICDWYYFKPAVTGKSWILRGNINSDNETFDEHSRGIQGLAISVVTLIVAKIIAPSKWSKQEVDDVIREGDAYYNWCNPPNGEVFPKSLKIFLHMKSLFNQTNYCTIFFKNNGF